jgi:hypothetical protein
MGIQFDKPVETVEDIKVVIMAKKERISAQIDKIASGVTTINEGWSFYYALRPIDNALTNGENAMLKTRLSEMEKAKGNN